MSCAECFRFSVYFITEMVKMSECSTEIVSRVSTKKRKKKKYGMVHLMLKCIHEVRISNGLIYFACKCTKLMWCGFYAECIDAQENPVKAHAHKNTQRVQVSGAQYVFVVVTSPSSSASSFTPPIEVIIIKRREKNTHTIGKKANIVFENVALWHTLCPTQEISLI